MLGFEELVNIALGSLRMGGLLVSMPVFGTSPIPAQTKFFFAIAMGMLLAPFHPSVPAELLENNTVVLLLAGKEVGIGLIMGFGARFIFLVVTMGMEFAGLQMGFAIANIIDPTNNDQISVLSQVGVVLVMLYLFGVNFHHDIFLALVRSYDLVPMGLPVWDMGGVVARMSVFLKDAFDLALRLSFPIMAAMLTMHLVLGIVSRTAPQMNLFFNVAFVVNIATGLLLLTLMYPQMFPSVRQYAAGLFQKGYGLW